MAVTKVRDFHSFEVSSIITFLVQQYVNIGKSYNDWAENFEIIFKDILNNEPYIA